MHASCAASGRLQGIISRGPLSITTRRSRTGPSQTAQDNYSVNIAQKLCRTDLRWPQRAAQQPRSRQQCTRQPICAQATSLKALLFDCDGVILESEELHRLSYNAAFKHFDVRCNGVGEVDQWSVDFYDMLQNRVGGGKAKMRWYFGEEGWPTSTVVTGVPSTDGDQGALIDTLQDWKSIYYQGLVGSGDVPTRPGVIRLMEEARAAGLLVAVCSASNKDSVILVLTNLLGIERFQALDLFLAGDDVAVKKPDPSIYLLAAQRLGLEPTECVVIEDSAIGCKAAKGAGMRCVITYTLNTKSGKFDGAESIVECLDGRPGVSEPITVAGLLKAPTNDAEPVDDRLLMSAVEV